MATFEELEKRVKLGDPKAMGSLGTKYWNIMFDNPAVKPHETIEHRKLAFYWWQEAAKRGDMLGKFYVAKMYSDFNNFEEHSLPYNIGKARQLLQEIVEQFNENTSDEFKKETKKMLKKLK